MGRAQLLRNPQPAQPKPEQHPFLPPLMRTGLLETGSEEGPRERWTTLQGSHRTHQPVSQDTPGTSAPLSGH